MKEVDQPVSECNCVVGEELTWYKCIIQFFKMFIQVIAKELLTTQGHVPFLLRQLANLKPMVRQLVMLYLRPRMRKMSHFDIQLMIDSGQVSIRDLDSCCEELS